MRVAVRVAAAAAMLMEGGLSSVHHICMVGWGYCDRRSTRRWACACHPSLRNSTRGVLRSVFAVISGAQVQVIAVLQTQVECKGCLCGSCVAATSRQLQTVCVTRGVSLEAWSYAAWFKLRVASS
jgi:hypothetical protein